MTAPPILPAAVNLVLIGPMGSGKSSVAREIARLTGRRWTDTDKRIVDGAGLPIAEIFARHGEAHFRSLESAALRSLAPESGLVVATGGGIVTQEENHPLLRALGVVVWLAAREEVLFERVSRNRRRPLLHTADPRGTLRELLAARDPLYRQCADVTVDSSDGTHADVAEAVLDKSRDFLAARAGRSGEPTPP